MSDTIKLNKAIDEYREANKHLDDKLKEVEAKNRQARQERTELSNH
ncbi:unnamed protein product [marine sediment metagenome]|uniref:Uncharacterized protein n=1 Tax=marine sediment metagenome TaxID=412755 RepID=X1EXQ4_9ZZZZ